MKNLSVMIKPASSLCNMRCKYCFYADISSIREQPSYGVMTSETRKKVLSNIFSQLDSGDSITFAFQGGEPTMAGIGWFRQFIQEARQLAGDGIQISYAFQTNGLLLDDDWLNLFKEHHFLVGLSLDGPKDFHDRNRPDAHGNGTFAHLLDIKKKMDRLHVSYNILTVLTNAAARHPQKLWNFLNEQQIAWVQFVPCLAPLDGEQNVYALTPERYASFYTALFDLWYPTLAQGRPMSIKLFDDLLALLAFGQETACGITGSWWRPTEMSIPAISTQWMNGCPEIFRRTISVHSTIHPRTLPSAPVPGRCRNSAGTVPTLPSAAEAVPA